MFMNVLDTCDSSWRHSPPDVRRRRTRGSLATTWGPQAEVGVFRNQWWKTTNELWQEILWGDLLRSVPHIKFGDKIKSHRYLDHSGWLGLIYCSNYRDHWRLLLFELETKILWLLKSVCHTVTRFVHALGPIKAIYLLFMLPNATNFSLMLEHISDFRYVHKQKSYAQNSDFVPFVKFGFVTVWQRKFEYFLPIIGFQKGQSSFLHDFIQV